MQVKNISLVSIEPPFDRVLMRLGYRKAKTEISPEIISNIKSEISDSMSYLHPSGNYIDESITNISKNIVTLDSGFTIKSEKVSKLLRECRKATLLICTIGHQFDIKVKGFMESGEMTKSVIWDAIGSESVEAFIEYIHEVLKQKNLLMGYVSTMRFSPGYGDLSTNIHREMLPLLKADEIDITCLDESFLLDPQKSVSAIIGWKK